MIFGFFLLLHKFYIIIVSTKSAVCPDTSFTSIRINLSSAEAVKVLRLNALFLPENIFFTNPGSDSSSFQTPVKPA